MIFHTWYVQCCSDVASDVLFVTFQTLVELWTQPKVKLNFCVDATVVLYFMNKTYRRCLYASFCCCVNTLHRSSTEAVHFLLLSRQFCWHSVVVAWKDFFEVSQYVSQVAYNYPLQYSTCSVLYFVPDSILLDGFLFSFFPINFLVWFVQ